MSIAYRDIALATPHDTETIEGAYEEGQNLLYSLRHDGPLPAERELTLEALKMVGDPIPYSRFPLLQIGQWAFLPGLFSPMWKE